MSDEELDNLFKEAAQEFKIQEDPTAWRYMSARLDEAGSTASFWNWKTISLSVIIGLMVFSILWYSFPSGSETNNLSQDQIISTLPQVNKSEIKKIENKKTQSTEIMVQNEVEHPEGQKPPATEEKTISQSNLLKPQKSLANRKLAKKQEAGARSSKTRMDNQAFGYRTYNKTRPLAGKDVESNGIRNPEEEQQRSITKPSNVSQQFTGEELLMASESLDDSLLRDSLSVPTALVLPIQDSLISNIKEPSEKSNSGKRSLSIKFSLSPDFSSIKYFTPDKPGINYGILVGYNFNNRWSVFTGAISSRKIYSSTEIDKAYTSPKGYDYPVEKLEGDCRVLDIPLNVYYSFHQGHSISFKIGLGVSSYLMLSEDYTYYVDNPYGSDEYSQSINHKNNEWFKMANISVAIQKKVGEKFYLEFEPFMKAPLAGIGEGNVSLVTLGAFINLRYDIYFKQ